MSAPIHGHALRKNGCECGVEPPPFLVPDQRALRAWHREHKADVARRLRGAGR